MPSNAENVQKVLEAALNVKCSIQDAEKVASNLGLISDSFRESHKNLAAFEKGLNSLSNAISSVGGPLKAFSGAINAPNLSMKTGYDIFIKYNDGLRQTSSQFSKYNISISQYQSKVESLRKTYQLTYPESVKMLSSFEKSFNVSGPEKFDGYMKAISNTVGTSAEAMEQFSQSIQTMTANNPALEQMITNLDFDGAKEYAEALVMSGKISMQQYKEMQNLVDAQNRNSQEQSDADKLNDPGKLQRGLAQGFEEGLKNAGADANYLAQKAVDQAGGIEKVNAAVSVMTQRYTEAAAAASLLAAAFSGVLTVASFGSAGGLAGRFGKGALGLGSKGLAAGARGASALASLGGGGLVGAAGVAGGIAGSAALGFGVGDYAASKAGLGIYDWSNQMGTDAANSMAMANSTEDPVRKAQLKAAALASKVDQEKMQSLGGFMGSFRSEGVASDETLKALQEAKEELKQLSAPIMAVKKAQDEINVAQSLMTPAEKEQTKEKEKQAAIQQTLVVRNMFTKQLLEQQNAILQGSSSLLSSQSILQGKGGRPDLIKASVDANNQYLDSTKKTTLEAIAQQEEKLKTAKNQNTINEATAELLKLQEALNQIDIKRNENAKININSNQAQLENQQKSIAYSEANIALQDSAGMGLKAQVGARKELIDKITQEIQLLQTQVDVASQERIAAENALRKAEAAGNQQDAIAAKAKILDMDNEILDKNTKITQSIQKQADASKAMREGWIGAINAMTTGAGVFTRITIDQNKRLGNLAFASPDNMKALRIGGTTGGRTESSSWTPGGMNYGKSGAFEESVMGQYGLGPNSNLQDIVRVQAERARTMNPTAAAAGVGPQGTAELTGALNTVAQTMTKTFGSDGKSSPKMIINEKDIEDIKKSFVDAFSKIGTEIITETLKRIRDK